MLKQKSNPWARLKFLYVLPLAAVSIQSLLDEIIRQSGISISVQHDPQKFRPVDYPSIAADISKLQRAIDWKPEISLERTIADTLTDWQIRLKNKVN